MSRKYPDDFWTDDSDFTTPELPVAPLHPLTALLVGAFIGLALVFGLMLLASVIYH